MQSYYRENPGFAESALKIKQNERSQLFLATAVFRLHIFVTFLPRENMGSFLKCYHYVAGVK